MTILVLNIGSTSFKYKLFSADFAIVKENRFSQEDITVEENFQKMMGEIEKRIQGVEGIQGINVDAIGHRVVHGGQEFRDTTRIDDGVLAQLENYSDLAPLHNPYNLAGIRASLKLMPKAPNFAVFDTAFFRNLPECARIYPIPQKYRESGIERFGFHGISHQFIAEEAAKKIGKNIKDCNFITLHLGGGSSITAIKNGKAIDTSMGFTPLEGLVMGTRPGDLDLGIVVKILKQENLSALDLDNLLNHKSGLKALTGLTDFRDILDAREKSDKNAVLAFEIFIYRIKKYIGAYFAILGRLDALVFTGAIGSGRDITRNEIVKDLKILEGVPVFAIETDEELQIAREIAKLLK